MLEWIIIGAAAAAAAKGVANHKAKQAQAQSQWFGHMQCQACGYLWTSRKQTPPARCPKCRSMNIGVLLGP